VYAKEDSDAYFLCVPQSLRPEFFYTLAKAILQNIKADMTIILDTIAENLVDDPLVYITNDPGSNDFSFIPKLEIPSMCSGLSATLLTMVI
jgi:hypothetical protein